jgi:tetratricopeptide (TPR) repeat protein
LKSDDSPVIVTGLFFCAEKLRQDEMTMKSIGSWVVLGFALVTALLYLPGLDGPFLLDDAQNLDPVQEYVDGHRTVESVVFGNRSGPLGRPVSMASFVANAKLGLFDAYHLKLVNLLIHLACGLIAWRLMKRLMEVDGSFRNPTLAAAVLAAAWLIAPAHVSTVLYVVQRMAQLSTLFMLLAIWAFVVGRQREALSPGSGWLWLLVLSPALTGLAAFSKENGILVPLIAGVIEIAYFRRSRERRLTPACRLYFGLFLLTPALLAAAALVLRPDYFLAGYEQRAFTLLERVLSQPRILWDYAGNLIVPHGPSMGIFHDNYPLSTGLLSPATTILAITGWALVIAIAIALRKRAPSMLAGIGIFFAGHALESSFLPLEPYFEHRNYFPSFGLLLALAALINTLITQGSPDEQNRKRLLTFVASVCAVVFSFATYSRNIVWSDFAHIMTQELRHNPTSPRMQTILAAEYMDAGRLDEALHHLRIAETYASDRDKMGISIAKALAHCAANTPIDDGLIDELLARKDAPISILALNVWERLSQRVEAGQCAAVDAGDLIAIGRSWLQSTSTPETEHGNWRVRYNLARMLASQGSLDEAAMLAHQAWESSRHNIGVGVFLFQVSASLGNMETCEEVLDILKKSKGKGDLRLDKAIETFQSAIDDWKSGRRIGARLIVPLTTSGST